MSYIACVTLASTYPFFHSYAAGKVNRNTMVTCGDILQPAAFVSSAHALQMYCCDKPFLFCRVYRAPYCWTWARFFRCRFFLFATHQRTLRKSTYLHSRWRRHQLRMVMGSECEGGTQMHNVPKTRFNIARQKGSQQARVHKPGNQR